MTTPSGQISTSDVTTELGLGATYSASLQFLNGYLKNPPASPNMDAFKDKAYYQRNMDGNCDNGNCSNTNCPPTNCTNCNCNCGNIQCQQCLPFGAFESQCTNCSGINCTNCDTQSYLQANCNCSSGYNCNCNATVGYNCGAAASATFNCNCACNCSKIVCADLYDKGLMSSTIWAADQAYGQMLRKTDKRVYRGYIRWARIVTSWMNAKGPDFMFWIKKESRRKIEQKIVATEMAVKIGTPWSEHMAYKMGVLKQDNTMGRIIMKIGTVICRVVSYIPPKPKSNRKQQVLAVYTIWALVFFTYYTALYLSKLIEFKEKLFQGKLENV